MSAVPCRCGGVCDDRDDGTACDGQVIAVDGDAPCPRHRCEAHCRKLGMTIGLAVSAEAMDLFAGLADRGQE